MRLRNGIANLALSIGSFCFALILAEFALRLFFPFSTFGGGHELDWFRKGPNLPLVVLDPSLGFRPVLNNGVYDDRGTIPASSLPARSVPTTTVLFMGDSVTARGRIIRQAARLVSNDAINYLNGGVEAYNIQQEVEFFFRYQASLKPQHIIHILHVNDLQSTPIAYRDSDGRLNVYAMYGSRRTLNPWLFEHLYLYRLLLGVSLPRPNPSELAEQAGQQLARMREYAQSSGATYEVALFPILAPYEKWSPYERSARDLILAAARKSGVRPLDLMPLANEASTKGIEIVEKRDDYWHPNERFSEMVADQFVRSFGSLKSLQLSAH